MTKHICWFKGTSLKCIICNLYKFERPVKEEKTKKWRTCLDNTAEGCPGRVYGYRVDRICWVCKNKRNASAA